MEARVLPLTCALLFSLVSVSSQIQWFRFLWVPEGSTTSAPVTNTSSTSTTTTTEEHTVAPVLPTAPPQPTDGPGKLRARKPLRMWKNDRGSKGHLILTDLVGVPLPPSVSFITGYEGFPAYYFGPNSNVGRLTHSFIPEPFFTDFAIIVTIRPSSSRGGVLFAITDPSQKMVHLGLALTPVEDKTQRIVLYYSEPGLSDSTEVASFKVPDMRQQWSRFTLSVEGEEVRLYMDCEEYHSAPLRRSTQPLRFQPGSGVFVANAGSTGLERFVGAIQQLVIKPDPRAAEEQCEEDDPSTSRPTSPIEAPPILTPDQEEGRFSGHVTSTDESLLGGKDKKGSVENLDLLAHQEPLDPLGLLYHTDIQGSLGQGGLKVRWVNLEDKAGQAKMDNLVREDLQDFQDYLENQESKEKRVTLAWVYQECQVHQDLLDYQDQLNLSKFLMDSMLSALDLEMVTSIQNFFEVHLDLLGLLVNLVHLVLVVHFTVWCLDLQEHLGKMVEMGNRDFLCLRTGLVALALPLALAQGLVLVLVKDRHCPGSFRSLNQMALLDSMVSKERRVNKESEDQLDLRGKMVTLALEVRLAPWDKGVYLDHLALPAHQGH
ncbi:hypothetical protein DNTS_002811 [Danionella cerebrum]|uniref:Thrombospondin-like N-terminal domain-containing protein n=1 Tax=Danionella cerebrum TaxID=2873325 RepID=A0A553ML04_9TELE|nr:hypothetical protein DNTS_002811 [Danionella translucida]